MTDYDLYSGVPLADHALLISHQLAMIEIGQRDTTAAVAEIDILVGRLSRLRERLTGQAAPGPMIGDTRVIGGEVQQYDGQVWLYVGAAQVPSGGAIDEQPCGQGKSQVQDLAELLTVLWRCHDDGLLPAELGSLLLGEFSHTRPGGEA